MNWHAAGLRRLDGIIWAIIASVAFIMLAAAATPSFRVLWATFLIPSAAIAMCLAAQWFYQTRRTDHRLAAALGCTAQLMAFAAVGAPLSYIGASLDLPLQDRWLDYADHALGFDWSAWLHWMDAHSAIHPLFFLLYFSLMPQTVIVVLVLSFTGHLAWLRAYMLAFQFTALATIALAALIPAEGVWGFYKLNADIYPNILPAVHGTYLPTFYGLRDGSYRLLLAAGSDGIITFPSLHAALAVLLPAALWPIPVLRWIILAIDIGMLFTVPVDGGHYFVDLFAGLAIAWASFAVARTIVKNVYEPPLSLANANIGLAPGN